MLGTNWKQIFQKSAGKPLPSGEYCYFCGRKQKKCWIMTTFALNNLWTYLQGLMLSQSEREWLVGKLSEPVEKVSDMAKEDTAKKTYKAIPISPKLKWLRIHIAAAPQWNRQEAWNRLTDKQREEATKLHLSAEDMDERTFYIIEKHLR